MERYKNIADIIAAFPDEQSCILHLEGLRWNGNVISPFNPISRVYRCKDRYRCSITKKYFNVKTGTLFHNSKIPLQLWFAAIWIVTIQKPNITSVSLGKELNITQKTAWFMIQRIKSYYTIEKTTPRSYEKKSVAIKPVAHDNNLHITVDHEKKDMLEWLKMLKK